MISCSILEEVKFKRPASPKHPDANKNNGCQPKSTCYWKRTRRIKFFGLSIEANKKKISYKLKIITIWMQVSVSFLNKMSYGRRKRKTLFSLFCTTLFIRSHCSLRLKSFHKAFRSQINFITLVLVHDMLEACPIHKKKKTSAHQNTYDHPLQKRSEAM